MYHRDLPTSNLLGSSWSPQAQGGKSPTGASILPGGEWAGGSPLSAGLQEMQPRGRSRGRGCGCQLVLAEPHGSTIPGNPHTLPRPRPSSGGPSKPSSSGAGGQSQALCLAPAPRIGGLPPGLIAGTYRQDRRAVSGSSFSPNSVSRLRLLPLLTTLSFRDIFLA